MVVSSNPTVPNRSESSASISKGVLNSRGSVPKNAAGGSNFMFESAVAAVNHEPNSEGAVRVSNSSTHFSLQSGQENGVFTFNLPTNNQTCNADHSHVSKSVDGGVLGQNHPENNLPQLTHQTTFLSNGFPITSTLQPSTTGHSFPAFSTVPVMTVPAPTVIAAAHCSRPTFVSLPTHNNIISSTHNPIPTIPIDSPSVVHFSSHIPTDIATSSAPADIQGSMPGFVNHNNQLYNILPPPATLSSFPTDRNILQPSSSSSPTVILGKTNVSTDFSHSGHIPTKHTFASFFHSHDSASPIQLAPLPSPYYKGNLPASTRWVS